MCFIKSDCPPCVDPPGDLGPVAPWGHPGGSALGSPHPTQAPLVLGSQHWTQFGALGAGRERRTPSTTHGAGPGAPQGEQDTKCWHSGQVTRDWAGDPMGARGPGPDPFAGEVTASRSAWRHPWPPPGTAHCGCGAGSPKNAARGTGCGTEAGTARLAGALAAHRRQLQQQERPQSVTLASESFGDISQMHFVPCGVQTSGKGFSCSD